MSSKLSKSWSDSLKTNDPKNVWNRHGTINTIKSQAEGGQASVVGTLHWWLLKISPVCVCVNCSSFWEVESRVLACKSGLVPWLALPIEYGRRDVVRLQMPWSHFAEKLFYIIFKSFTQLRNISEDVPDTIRDKAMKKRQEPQSSTEQRQEINKQANDPRWSCQIVKSHTGGMNKEGLGKGGQLGKTFLEGGATGADICKIWGQRESQT